MKDADRRVPGERLKRPVPFTVLQWGFQVYLDFGGIRLGLGDMGRTLRIASDLSVGKRRCQIPIERLRMSSTAEIPTRGAEFALTAPAGRTAATIPRHRNGLSRSGLGHSPFPWHGLCSDTLSSGDELDDYLPEETFTPHSA